MLARNAGLTSAAFSTGYSDRNWRERCGGEMSLDALDKKTLSSLPRLSDVYDSYGVEVNALSVSEVFALYERTGFLYPDKAARLLPHLEQVRENWRRMLRGGNSLLYVLTAGDNKRGRASIAVWRTTHHGWTSQHLVSENNPIASRAVMLAGTAASILRGVDESHQNWFRPENRFPSRVFGSMVQTIGQSLSSVQRHMYFALPRNSSLPSGGRVRIVPYDPSHEDALTLIASVARGSIPYSLVTQPLPLPFRKGGTPSSTVAVQITRVFPSSISTLPSAVEIKSGVIFRGRIWSAARPSLLTRPPALLCSRVFRSEAFCHRCASLTTRWSGVNGDGGAMKALVLLAAPAAAELAGV